MLLKWNKTRQSSSIGKSLMSLLLSRTFRLTTPSKLVTTLCSRTRQRSLTISHSNRVQANLTHTLKARISKSNQIRRFAMINLLKLTKQLTKRMLTTARAETEQPNLALLTDVHSMEEIGVNQSAKASSAPCVKTR